MIEPYEFVRTARNLRTEAGAPGDLTSSTTGVRLAGKLSPRTDYNVEAAVQRGSLGSDTISAWAGHGWSAARFRSGSKTYRAFGEYNFASGDDTPGDGTRGTFDQLYPTAHDKYGLADQVGWKNIHHLRTGARSHGRTPKLALSRQLSLVLARERHAMRSTARAAPCSRASPPARRIAMSGRSSISRRPTRHRRASSCTAATRTSSPGAFLKAATPGKSYSAPYVMVTTMLLGLEK